MSEQWRDIEGYEGYYQVSDHGRVRSLRRRALNSDRPRKKPLVLSRFPDSSGYLTVTLGKHGLVKVHHLVLETFVGQRPPGHEAVILDGDRKDIRLENLAWLPPNENPNRVKITDEEEEAVTPPRRSEPVTDMAEYRRALRERMEGGKRHEQFTELRRPYTVSSGWVRSACARLYTSPVTGRKMVA